MAKTIRLRNVFNGSVEENELRYIKKKKTNKKKKMEPFNKKDRKA